MKAPFITFSGKFDASLIEIKGDYTPAQELWKTNLNLGTAENYLPEADEFNWWKNLGIITLIGTPALVSLYFLRAKKNQKKNTIPTDNKTNDVKVKKKRPKI